MEFMTGKKEKEVLDLAAVFADGMEGREVKVNGAIMSVRNMGDIAFVILRKRDGVLQTVYEKGVTDADFAELREETFVEVSGVLRKEERAPRGMELRLKSVRILSKPEEPMPIAVSKWKMSASLEATGKPILRRKQKNEKTKQCKRLELRLDHICYKFRKRRCKLLPHVRKQGRSGRKAGRHGYRRWGLRF